MARMETGRPPLEQLEALPPHGDPFGEEPGEALSAAGEELIPGEDTGEPVDEDQQLRQAAAALLGFLEREPGAMHSVERIVSEHLRGVMNTETAQMLFNSLARYAGEDNANFLLSLLMRGVDNPEFFAQVGEYLGGEAWAAVRALSALYGDAVQEAYLVGGENPNAWRTVNRQVYYDVISGQWRMTFEIIKYNGERALYEETATSLLILADAIVDTLNHMPADVAPEMIDRSRRETFYDTCTTFFDTYAPPAEEQGAEEVPESSGEAAG